jgi:hypothetical protein
MDLGFLLFFHAGCLCVPLSGGKDTSRRAMVEERIQDAIMGHEPEHVSSKYGLGYGPAGLNKSIEAVTYPGLDLTSFHLSKR